MNLNYWQRIIDNPNSSREDYLEAWNILANAVQAQHQVNAVADKFVLKLESTN
jgi:hypothetical protein